MTPRLGGLFLLLACAAPAAADEAPQYQGKTAREWTQELADAALPLRLQAIAALGELGPDAREAIPALLQMLKERGPAQANPNTLSAAGLVASQSLARIGRPAVPALLNALASDQPRVRAGAAHALGLIRPPLPPALAPLQTALKDRDEHVRYQAALALLRLGQKADVVTPVLNDLLRALTPAIRLETALLLQELGSAAKTTAPALVEALRDEFLELPSLTGEGLQDGGMPTARPRNAAVNALASIGSAAVPVLVKAASDADSQVRAGALLALSSIQPLAREAREVLQAGLKDRDTGVRLLAAVNLWRLTHEAGPVLPILRDALNDPDADQSAVAALALAQIGAPARDVIPTLIERLKDPKRSAVARHALGLFGSEATPALVRLLGDDELSAQAVSLLQISIRDALPLLLKALDSERATVRAAAAEALSTPGAHAARVLPALRDAARDIDSRVRFQALTALALLDLSGPPEVAAGLGDFLKQKTFPRRRQAALALAVMGRQAGKAIPALEAALEDADVQLRRIAARVLYPLAPDNRKAVDVLFDEMRETSRQGQRLIPVQFLAPTVPRLIELFKEGPDPLRLAVLNVLRGLRADSQAAAPALIAALEDSSPIVASQIVAIVGRLGEKAKEYVPALEKACQKHPAGKTPSMLARIGRMGPEGLAALHRLAAKSPVRQQAIQALGLLGDRGKATLDLLTSALKGESQYLRHDAARSLIALGMPELAAPVMREWLRESDLEWRRMTVQELSTRPPDASALVPLLIESLKDRDAHIPYHPYPQPAVFQGAGGNGTLGGTSPGSIRGMALVALARIGPAAKEAVPALLGLLASEDAGCRALVADTLGEIGPRAKAAIPALRKALKDEDSDVRLAAAGALARLDRQSAEAVPILIAALKEQPLGGGDSSLESKLTNLGRLAVPALMALVRERNNSGPADDGRGLFPSQDGYYRATEAAHLLGLIGPDAEEATPLLLETLQERRKLRIDPVSLSEPFGPSLRHASAFALGRIGPKAKRAAPILLAIAKDLAEDAGLRVQALESVMLLDPQPAFVAPLVKSLLHGQLLRGAAISPTFHFVTQLGADARDLVPLLAGALDRSGAVTHAEAASLLALLPEAKQALPQLRAALSDPSARLLAAEVIAVIEGNAASAALLAEVIAERRLAPARSSAVAVLASMSEENVRNLLPAFRRWLHDADAQVRVQAAAGLWKHAKDGKTTIPVLRGGLENGDNQVRKATAEALGKLGALARPLAEALKELLEDSDREVREAAAAALKRVEKS